MRKMMFCCIAMLALMFLAACGQDSPEDQQYVTASEIQVRFAPSAPHQNITRVVVTVSGPSEPVVVRRKDRRYGIWINVEAADVDAAPSFYAVATSAPWKDVITNTEDLRHKVSIPRAASSARSAAPKS